MRPALYRLGQRSCGAQCEAIGEHRDEDELEGETNALEKKMMKRRR
jgi:hypothetical protein